MTGFKPQSENGFSNTPKPYLIGISGGSGSGKTSFIKSIRKRFSEDELCILSLDNYYKPREEQRLDSQGVRNFDLPSSIDKKKFRKDLQQLLSGNTVEKEEYTFNNELKTAQTLIFKSAPVIIVEGLFVFKFRKISEMLDLKIFVSAKDNLKVIRRILRDKEERNYPLDDVLYRYEHHVLPTYEKYILPHRDEADIVVNNNENFSEALEVVCGFIRTKVDA